MRTGRRRPFRHGLVSRGLAATTASALTLLAGVTLAGPALADDALCSDVLFVGARGSGQTGAYGAEVDAVRRGLVTEVTRAGSSAPTVDQAGVGYAAVDARQLFTGSTGQQLFLDSVTIGAEATAAVLRARAQACPDQILVLAGYSQGAMAVQGGLAELSSRPDILARVAGVVLVASGDREYDWPAEEKGSSRRGEGVRPGLLDVDPLDLPQALDGRVASLCNSWDAVCDFQRFHGFRWGDVPRGLRVHTNSYRDGVGERLGRDVAKTVLAAPVPASVRYEIPVDEPFRMTLDAHPATGRSTQQSWAVEKGALPPGMALRTTGVLEGTPTHAGTYEARVSVEGDTDGLRLSATVTVVVRGDLPGEGESPAGQPLRLSVTPTGEPTTAGSQSGRTSGDGRVAVHLTFEPEWGATSSAPVAVLTRTDTGQRTPLPTPEGAGMFGLAVSGDGTTVALVGRESTLFVDTASMASTEWTAAASGHPELTQDGRYLAVETESGPTIYDRSEGRVTHTVAAPADVSGPLRMQAFSDDGHYLHVSDPSWKRTWSFDTTSGQLTEISPVGADTVWIRYSDDGGRAAVIDPDGHLIIRDLTTGTDTRSVNPMFHGLGQWMPAWPSNTGDRVLFQELRDWADGDYNPNVLRLHTLSTGQTRTVDTVDNVDVAVPAGDLGFVAYGRQLLVGEYGQANVFWSSLR